MESYVLLGQLGRNLLRSQNSATAKLLQSTKFYRPASGAYSVSKARNYSVAAKANPEDSAVRLPLFNPVLQPKFQNKIGFTDFRGANLTYSEIGNKSSQLAKQLKELTGNGEARIAFLCPHDSSFLITLWGTWMANHVAVPLSEKHPENLLEYFTKHTEAKVIVTTKQYADQMRKLATAANTQLHVVDFDALPNTPALDAGTITYGDSDNALILFTSGTTGLPKGVLLTHQNLQDQVNNICQAWEITSKDTLLHVLPLHHTHGLIHALASPMAVGARCHMLEKFDAKKAWAELLSNSEQRPSVLMGVPTVYSKLIEEYDKTYGKSPSQVEFVKATCQSKMRLMLSGSASLPVPVIERWEQITGYRLLERYGMTEIGMALTNPLHGERRPGFVGAPFQSVKLRLVDLTSRDSYKVLAEGTGRGTQVLTDEKEVVGDLLIKGPSVFKEYLKNPEATKKEFTHDGWFITGDQVGYIDGSYKILGRKSVDIIKSGGYKLSALEIETQLLAFDEIVEVSVCGLPDPTWGQKVAAMIVWKNKELTLEELRTLAKTRLPGYACPSVIQTIKELPKNQLGKVNKKELVKLFK